MNRGSTETSLQAQILIPLATSLAFGLTSATMIAIFLVPAIYCVLDDFNALGQVEMSSNIDSNSATTIEAPGTRLI